jgi:cobaltochelatase CobS
MTKALQDALSIADFTERRKALRALATPIIDMWARPLIREAFDGSPLVGDGPNQVTPRPTPSGLRDCLDLDTLCAIIDGRLSESAVLHAIKHPDRTGTPSASAKCGYVFGRPAGVQPIDPSDTATEEPRMAKASTNIEDFGLEDLVAIHDSLVVNHSWESEEAMAAMRDHFTDPARLAPLDGLFAARSDFAIAPEPTEAASDVVLHLNARRMTAEGDADVSIPPKPSGDQAKLIDLALASASLPSIADMIDQMSALQKQAADAKAKAVAMPVVNTPTEVVGDGTIPSGKPVLRKAKDVFGITGEGASSFDFDVPVWEWDGIHPHVPTVDVNYVFRPMSLLRVLYALITNQPAWLHGHSGSGKTTLIEQVSARLCWPFGRVNFDSEITRLDLIGRDVLTNDGGTTASKFVDGILPQLLSGPYIACYDEMDFIRPDVAYVMQRTFEGNGLVITEDGGRIVQPHTHYRAFATSNTVGQGDEFGMYQGARPQSMALLDRFKVWIHVEYMDKPQREELIKSAVPSLKADMRRKVSKYVEEHLNAFTTSKVLQPISPRGFIALSQALVTFTALMPDQNLATKQAVETVILDRCSAQDRAVLAGITNRVFSV